MLRIEQRLPENGDAPGAHVDRLRLRCRLPVGPKRRIVRIAALIEDARARVPRVLLEKREQPFRLRPLRRLPSVDHRADLAQRRFHLGFLGGGEIRFIGQFVGERLLENHQPR